MASVALSRAHTREDEPFLPCITRIKYITCRINCGKTLRTHGASTPSWANASTGDLVSDHVKMDLLLIHGSGCVCAGRLLRLGSPFWMRGNMQNR